GISGVGFVLGGGVSLKKGELSGFVQVWPLSQGWREVNQSFSPAVISISERETNIIRYNFPFLSVKATYFLNSSFGVSLAFSMLDMDKTHYFFDEYNNTWIQGYEHMSTREVSLEMIYRFQFGF
ncbi:MAG: hypothetical protein ACK4HQ_08310, partial [Brevinematales bacterium]